MQRITDFLALYRIFRQYHPITQAARYAWAIAKEWT